jgi:acetolactate decarboxylase
MKTMLSSVNGVLPRIGGASFNSVKPQPNKLFQTSTMAALLDAVYDGEISVAELLKHGNFGIGTFNALDGEMIVNDSVVHQFRSGGHAGAVLSDLQTPFACVTYFEPETSLVIHAPKDKKELETLVDELVGNQNLFVAVRFIGEFDEVETRTVFSQHPPYPPMLDVVRQQPTQKFAATRGTMLGFRTPDYMQGISVAGYHLHFLDEEQKMGGHVTGYRLHKGQLELAVISDFEIQLPRSRQFCEANLSPDDINEAIRTAEGE